MKEKIIKTIFGSWHPILIGSLVVAVISSSEIYNNFIAENKKDIMLLLIMYYILFVFYITVFLAKRDKQTLLQMIILGGFLLRAYYVLVAPYNTTKHDIGSFAGFDTSDVYSGHFGYIEYIYKFHQLPDFDPSSRWSFYNPPGFYIISAVTLWVTQIFHVEVPLCYEVLQAVTLFFSSLTVWTFCRILEEFSISDKIVLWMAALLSVHPFYSIMSVTLNNDCMTMYLMSLSVLYCIRWYKQPILKNILVTALSVGIAMLTKVSAALIAFGIGEIFVCVFWKRRKEYKKIICQFAAFLTVCVPIGMFNPIRNWVKWGLPFTYFQKISTNSSQYISEQTLFSCIGFPTLEQMSYAFIKFNTAIERNAWVQALRTSLFDEIMPLEVSSTFANKCSLALLWISAFLAILLNLALMWCIIRKNILPAELKLFLVLEYGLMIFAYAKTAMSEPFICTMNYRYIPISMLFPIIGDSIWLDTYGDKSRVGTVIRKVSCFLIANFCIFALFAEICLIAWSDLQL